MRTLLALLLLSSCSKAAPKPSAAAAQPLVGTRPLTVSPAIGAFRATSTDGSVRGPDDLRGQPTVLWFFPAANTGGCTVEGCGYRDLYDEFAALGVSIVGVSFTDVSVNAEWSERLEFPYEIWRDDQRVLAQYYGAVDDPNTATYPSRRTRILDSRGELVLEYNDNIIVGAHPAEVLTDVRTLMSELE